MRRGSARPGDLILAKPVGKLRRRSRMTLRRMLLIGWVAVFVIIGALSWRHLKKERRFATRIVEHVATGAVTESAFAPVEDWPRWRGPRGDGISREKNLAE